MYTVYGIYKKRSKRALYVGSTKLSLSARFSVHIGSRPSELLIRPPHKLTTARHKLMQEHRDGKAHLEIREIIKCKSKADACDMEGIEIIARKPLFNITFPGRYYGLGQTCLPREKVLLFLNLLHEDLVEIGIRSKASWPYVHKLLRGSSTITTAKAKRVIEEATAYIQKP